MIGPTGVFVINSKNHSRVSVLVDDEYLIFNRKRYPEPSDAARDARRAAAALGLKTAVPLVAVSGATAITVKSDAIATVCSVDDVVSAISNGRRWLAAEQIREIYALAIQPTTWGIDEASLRDEHEILHQFSLIAQAPASNPRKGTSASRSPYRTSRGSYQRRRRRSSLPRRKVAIFLALMVALSVANAGQNNAVKQDVVHPGSQYVENPLTKPGTAIDPTAQTGGPVNGHSLGHVRSSTYLFLCSMNRRSVATPIGDTSSTGGTLFVVAPSSIQYCMMPNVYHFGTASPATVIDSKLGLISVEIEVEGFALGPAVKNGKYKVVLTTDTDISFLPVQVRRQSGVFEASVPAKAQTWLTGSPVIDSDGKLAGILESDSRVISTHILDRE